MARTLYGYRIENGMAVIDEEAAGKLRQLYANYLSGRTLETAAKEAGIDTYHTTAKNLMRNKRYLGDDFYPAIIDEQVFQATQAELMRRATALGRMDRVSKERELTIPTSFSMGEIEEYFDNPATQAEYVYSRIKSEVG